MLIFRSLISDKGFAVAVGKDPFRMTFHVNRSFFGNDCGFTKKGIHTALIVTYTVV